MADIRWHVLTIGHLSRNRFWGESDDQAYRTPLCTTTLLRLDDRTIIVDPGCDPDVMERVLFERSGLRPEAVDMVFLTHAHGDHYVGISTFPHARWCMGASDVEHWKAQASPDRAEQSVLARLEPIVGELAPGITLLPTPGHALAHTSLSFTSDGYHVVIAGDAIMTQDFFLAQDVYFNTVDRSAAVQSIKTIAQRADIIIPGHDNAFVHRRSWRERATNG